MEAKWPSFNESAQFKCDMIAQYLQKFDWEDDEDDDKSVYEYSSDTDDEDAVVDDNEEGEGEGEGEGKGKEGKGEREVRRYSYKIGSLKEFLKQVRTTRGYNVDAAAMRSMNSPFLNVMPEFRHNYDIVLSKAIEVAINHINSKTGKVYKHVRTLRVVDSPNRLLLFTFTAKTADAGEQTADAGEKTADAGEQTADAGEQTGEQTADAGEQTFLATVYAPAFRAPIEDFELLECFLKPEGLAPWEYVDFKSYVNLKVF